MAGPVLLTDLAKVLRNNSQYKCQLRYHRGHFVCTLIKKNTALSGTGETVSEAVENCLVQAELDPNWKMPPP